MKHNTRIISFVLFMLTVASLSCTLPGGTLSTEHGTGATITVNNTGSIPICYIFISTPDDNS